MRVCIIGAGVAGIQVADALSSAGHECHVFEKHASVGGVWRENYEGYALQVPAELYEFPDVAHRIPDGSFPDGRTVQAYIERFCSEKRLFERCHFHFEHHVERIEQMELGSWRVRASNPPGSRMYTFDYCVMCTGMYHVPHIPAAVARFDPTHTSSFKDASVVRGRSVAVIGGGKSAIDCAVAASRHAMHVKLVQREMHWPVPRFILGLIPFKWCTYSRLGHVLLPKHWSLSTTELVFHVLLYPFKYLVWRLMELIVCHQFDLTYNEYARMCRLEVDLFNGGQVLTKELNDAMESGRITRVITSRPENVIETDDVVICGTGFTKDYSIFDERTVDTLDIAADGLWLYKNILPPCIPTLAFVGSEVSTFNNLLTSHLQSQWLSHYLSSATHSVHTPDNMMAHIDAERKWKRSWMNPSPSRASLLQLHMTKYHDILMDDMGRGRVKYRWWQWALPHHGRDFSTN